MFDIRYLTVGFIIFHSFVTYASAPSSSSISSFAPGSSIRLTSDTMGIVSKFVDGTRIRQIVNYRKRILVILIGKLQPDRTRLGEYLLQDMRCSIEDLKKIEEALEMQKDSLNPQEYAAKKNALAQVLEIAKHDFKHKSEEFRSVSNTKQIMAKLIEESLLKRNRHDSVLLSWTQSRCDEDEEKIFHEEVLTFKIFEEFLHDLYNFLGDLIESCPEANQQYEIYAKKCRKVYQLSTGIMQKNESMQSFLDYVCNNYIEKLKLEEITQEKVKHLYELYKKQK